MHSYIFPKFQGHGSIQQVNDKQQCSKNIDDLQKIAINIVTYKPFVGLHPYIERRFRFFQKTILLQLLLKIKIVMK